MSGFYKKPSGAQRRKLQAGREKERKALAGSMLAYLKHPKLDEEAGEGTSKQVQDTADTVPQQPSTYVSDVPPESSFALPCVEEEGLVDLQEEVVESEVLELPEPEDSSEEEEIDPDLPRKTVEMFSDVSSWDIPVPDAFRVEIVRKGSEPFQNKDGPFKPVWRPGGGQIKGIMRQLSTNWFYRSMPDGEKQLRSWMVYSCVTHKLYCFCCRLFATSVSAASSSFVTGFQNWWKLNPKVVNHERSEEHQNFLRKWNVLAAGLRESKTMDSAALAVVDSEKRKWRHLLKILLDITLFLARQNLPFRGHREDLASLNRGNFLELVELLSHYDEVLREHLDTLRQSGKLKAAITYLSPATQNEFITLLGDHVKQQLVEEIKNAGFFGMMFDSTPDISHTDQMSEVIRYVVIKDRKVEVKESFLGFFPLQGKKAVDLCTEILGALERDGLDIMDCRSQGYDNAANMAGIHGGVQALIQEKNPKAIFNGCVDYSLNLCGQHSFEENGTSSNFFGKLGTLFSFFSGSTERWQMLLDHAGTSLQHLSMTRWTAHYAAVKPVAENYPQLVEAINDICDCPSNPEIQQAARNLSEAISEFSFLCFLYFWCDVLKEVDTVQRYLQTEGVALDSVVSALESLKLFLQKERNKLVDSAMRHALLTAEEYGIPVQRRPRIKKRMPGEKASDAGLSFQEENRRAMFECIDRFQSELDHRSRGLNDVAERFEAIHGRSLILATEDDLRASIPKLTTLYDEISESDLEIEIGRLRRHLRGAKIDLEKAKDWVAMDFLKCIVENRWFVFFPNIYRSLRLFLTICVSVASCERSFSKLKLIKDYLRSNMGQARLSGLAMLSIERELSQKNNNLKG